MDYFKEIYDLPTYDLYSELKKLITDNVIKWNTNQICLNTIIGKENDYDFGTGSLIYNWANATETIDEIGNKKITIKEYDKPYLESDFTILCNQFKNTLFETVYNNLQNKFSLGRVRLMKSNPHTCLSWHTDTSTRIHYPIKTQEGCFMVIENEIKHLTKNTWWETNTILQHTAFNASKEDRIHLVAVIL